LIRDGLVFCLHTNRMAAGGAYRQALQHGAGGAALAHYILLDVQTRAAQLPHADTPNLWHVRILR